MLAAHDELPVDPVTNRNDPLDLEGRLDGDAVGSELVDQPLQQQATALVVRFAGLRVPVRRRPGPSGLRGEGYEAAQIGEEPQVPNRCGVVA